MESDGSANRNRCVWVTWNPAHVFNMTWHIRPCRFFHDMFKGSEIEEARRAAVIEQEIEHSAAHLNYSAFHFERLRPIHQWRDIPIITWSFLADDPVCLRQGCSNSVPEGRCPASFPLSLCCNTPDSNDEDHSHASNELIIWIMCVTAESDGKQAHLLFYFFTVDRQIRISSSVSWV